ncbi:MAG TPA: alpha/beta fold hydrolase [Candidatus Acidoferrales bacterium]|nr:alpha/beta fold hydrolase [Candidatus Acidoferrales bacterium]
MLFPDLCLMVLAGMIAVPPKAPPPLESSPAVFHLPEYTHVPPIQLYRARDGSRLAYRAYPGRDDRVAVLIHGSSGDSTTMHALAKALSSAGITTCALDLRGHGDSGKLGDIAYMGQLDDDLADFVPVVRSRHPKAKLALVAFSAGGGFGLRFASGPYGRLFDDYVLLSPYLGADAAVLLRPAARAWSEVDTPRVTGISVLDRIGIHWFDGLPAVAFAVPPDISQIQASTYSIRLARNFGCEPGCRGDFRSVHRPMTLLVGGGDELFYANLFPEFIAGVRPDIPVAVLGHYGHMDMIWNPQAVREIEGRIAGILRVPEATPSAPDSPVNPAGSGQPSHAALRSPSSVYR